MARKPVEQFFGRAICWSLIGFRPSQRKARSLRLPDSEDFRRDAKHLLWNGKYRCPETEFHAATLCKLQVFYLRTTKCEPGRETSVYLRTFPGNNTSRATPAKSK